MRSRFQQVKTLSIVCGLVVILEFLIFFWTMDGSRYQQPRRQQKTIEDLPRDSLRTFVMHQTRNETKAPLIGLHISKQILPPRLPVHNKNVIQGPMKNISAIESHRKQRIEKHPFHKKQKMDKLPKKNRFPRKRFRRHHAKKKIKK